MSDEIPTVAQERRQEAERRLTIASEDVAVARLCLFA